MFQTLWAELRTVILCELVEALFASDQVIILRKLDFQNNSVDNLYTVKEVKSCLYF